MAQQHAEINQATLKPRPVVKPTNLVTFRTQLVRARIDPTLPVSDVVRQLCLSFGVTDPPSYWELRANENGELLTDESLFRFVRDNISLDLLPSTLSQVQALRETILSVDTPSTALKLALFQLQKRVKDSNFAETFVDQGGLKDIVSSIGQLEGNTLAYALGAIEGLLEFTCKNEQGNPVVDSQVILCHGFVQMITGVVSSRSSPINITRPATSILRYLVPINFQVVYSSTQSHPLFMDRVVERLKSGEGGEVLHSLLLINSLISTSSEGTKTSEVLTNLDKHEIQLIIEDLMDRPCGDEMRKALLGYRFNIAYAISKSSQSFVDTTYNLSHRLLLLHIWDSAGLTDVELKVWSKDIIRTKLISDEEELKWSVLGLDMSHSAGRNKVIWKTGKLGLDYLHWFATNDRAAFASLIHKQLRAKPSERCPIGQASNETLDHLLAQFSIHDISPGQIVTSFVLQLRHIYSLALHFFLRMWEESNSMVDERGGEDDFRRVSEVVKFWIKEVFTVGAQRTMIQSSGFQRAKGKDYSWIEKMFRESEWSELRWKMRQAGEEERELLDNIAIRDLTSSILEQCQNFVQEQRINCLLEGAWFKHGALTGPYFREPTRDVPRGWTFVRLAPNKHFLAYCETQHQFSAKPTIDELSERIDLNLVHEIATKTAYPIVSETFGLDNGPSKVEISKRTVPSDLSFSLLVGKGISVLDLVALNRAQFSEWIDGIGYLLGRSPPTQTQETMELIKHLTEVGLKLRLLDITGEEVEVPDELPIPAPPSNYNFVSIGIPEIPERPHDLTNTRYLGSTLRTRCS